MIPNSICFPCLCALHRSGRVFHLVFAALLLFLAVAARAADRPVQREWTINGTVRNALVFAPAKAGTNGAPLIFAFHGHGGTMNHAARRFGLHRIWPEAIVVYPQGLNTPGRLTDPEGKRPGWQARHGLQEDRDLKLFDFLLQELGKEYNVDSNRVYATGHSNGGGFTYLLWSARGDRLAAVAPVAAAARVLAELKPKPVLHAAGEKDTLVKYEWQKATMESLRKLNQCAEGKPWENQKWCTVYPSRLGAPVVTLIHPGGHEYPAGAAEAIVKFFKQHPAPAAR